MKTQYAIACALVSCFWLNSLASGQNDKSAATKTKEEKKQKFSVADDYLTFEAPASWIKVKPKINFIHADFTIPKSDGDERDGRITFSQVGGSIEQNIERWIDQFKDVDADDEEQVKRFTKTIDGKQVQLIMIHGTFLDSGGGPFGPKTEREDYMLWGAAIEAESGGNVYVKAYGPKKTMEANHKAIEKMLAGMKSTDG